MADALLSLVVRGTRRIRLLFSSSLALAAFTSLTPYAVSNLDGLGAPSIAVVQAFVIASDPTAIELAIDSDIVSGALYQVTVTSVPMADASTVSGSLQVRTGAALQTLANVEPAQNDVDLLLFKRDLYHNGADIVEGPDGDLATITGPDNYESALTRRVSSAGLGWDPAYSPHADAYVNAPSILQLPLKGAVLAQARLDPRTRSATCDIVQDTLDPESVHFVLTAQAIDGRQPIEVSVPAS